MIIIKTIVKRAKNRYSLIVKMFVDTPNDPRLIYCFSYCTLITTKYFVCLRMCKVFLTKVAQIGNCKLL